MLENRTIAVVGLGYVGLPLAIEYGKKYRVIGFDVFQPRVEELQRGEDHTLEADLIGMKQACDADTATRKSGSLSPPTPKNSDKQTPISLLSPHLSTVSTTPTSRHFSRQVRPSAKRSTVAT